MCWDPLRGHGGVTPIGRALAFARSLAENWVNDAQGMEFRRAVIYVLSDGIVEPATEPDGLEERQKISDFNRALEARKDTEGLKGQVRLATMGYYQYEQ